MTSMAGMEIGEDIHEDRRRPMMRMTGCDQGAIQVDLQGVGIQGKEKRGEKTLFTDKRNEERKKRDSDSMGKMKKNMECFDWLVGCNEHTE